MYVPPDFLTYLSVGQIRTTYVGLNPSDTKTGSGTCFFIKKDSNFFVVTNRHNLDFDYYKGESTGYSLDKVFVAFHIKDTNLSENKLSINHKTSEIPAKIFNLMPVSYSDNKHEDVIVFIIMLPKHLEIFAINSDELGTHTDFCSTKPGEPIIIHGFSENAPTNYPFPITRAGIVSFVPEFDFCGKKDESARRALVEFLSTKGMSGSPVFVSQRGFKGDGSVIYNGYRRGYLLGINCGHYHADDQRNSLIHAHLSNCIKATVISELIEKCEKTYLNSKADFCEDAS
jgi:hypothetical protein